MTQIKPHRIDRSFLRLKPAPALPVGVSAMSLFLDFWASLLRSVLSFSDSYTHNFATPAACAFTSPN